MPISIYYFEESFYLRCSASLLQFKLQNDNIN